MGSKAKDFSRARGRARLRTVALPTEHGGWGLILEPILLGVLVAPSPGGLSLAVAAMAVFLTRQPLKVLTMDRRRGLHTSRTKAARQFLALYLGIAAVGATITLWVGDPGFLIPLLMALPIGLLFLFYDLSRPGRSLAAEIVAPVALASVAAAIPLAAGWLIAPALALWVALSARAVPSILYVRARLRLDRKKPTTIVLPIAAHGIALLPVAWLVTLELLPQAAIWAFLLLLLRAVVFLSPRRPMVSVKIIGFTELGLGILVVLTIAFPYWFA